MISLLLNELYTNTSYYEQSNFQIEEWGSISWQHYINLNLNLIDFITFPGPTVGA